MNQKKLTQKELSFRPPIVAVLGHVDHGKTTLLDTIRKTSVASSEHGGITQHIGAYQVALPDGRKITFIDTPGHEAFSKMRYRGASTADIAILVVAADDSVMPQTIESIKQIKLAQIPYIVVCNKIDLEAANIDKVKQDLAKNGVQVEGFGGEVPFIGVSAKANTGIKDLIELILHVAGIHGFPNEENASLAASVVETKVDKGKGMVATVIIKKGTLKSGMVLYEDTKQVVKVRALFDENGKKVDVATPSKPVEIIGFTSLPSVGSLLTATQNQSVQIAPTEKIQSDELPDFLKPIDINENNHLNIVIKADTTGSLEAIIQALDEKITIVYSGLGQISEADILLAKSCKAFVIGFNVKEPSEIEKLAFSEKVAVRTYTIIYELLDELEDVVNGMQEVLTQERELGKAQIIASFPFNDQLVAGTKVMSGRIARGDSIRIERDNKEIFRAKIKSLRHGKDEISKIETGGECGVLFDKKVDFSIGDAIIAFTNI